MKFVIRPYDSPEWMENYFPDLDILSLSICNKPLIEYHFDFLYMLGCTDVLVVLPNYQQDIFELINRESEWGLRIRIEIANNEEGYKSIENRCSDFFEGPEYGVIEGNIFISYDQRNLDYFQGLKDRKRITISKQDQSTITTVEEIDTLKKYFDLSVNIINRFPKNYNLPGFGYQNDGFVGKGVTLKNNDSISRGVHLGDYVLIHKNALIKKGSIIGRNVVIDSNVEIEASIIYKNTVVGEGLLLKNKIVFKDRVICPFSGQVARVDQRALLPLAENRNYREVINNKIQSLVATSLYLYSLPVWAVLKLVSLVSWKDLFLEESFVSLSGDRVKFSKINSDISKKNKILNFIVEIFLVSYSSQLFYAAIGDMYLIAGKSVHRKKVNNIPSVFTFGSLIKDPDLLPYSDVFDLYYQVSPKVISNIYALFKIIFSRIIVLLR